MSLDSDAEQLSLLELLDRALYKGVTLSGDITISLAGVDLIYLGLRALLSSVETAEKAGWWYQYPKKVWHGADESGTLPLRHYQA